MNGLFLVTTFRRAAGSLKMYLSPHLLLVYSFIHVLLYQMKHGEA